MEWVDKERVQGVMEKRELVIRKTGLKGRHSAGCNSYKQGRTVVGASWKVVSSLGCIDREMVELRILRGGSNANGGSQL